VYRKKTAAIPNGRNMSRSPHAAPPSPSANLLDRLRELKRSDEESQVESTVARARWLEDVENLLRAIRAWMLPATNEGLARIDSATVHVTEDDVGAYDAPALKITFPGSRIVWIRPVGTMQVGAQGIVDVVCGSNRALLVLNRSGVWKVRGSDANSSLVPLDGHAFSRALGELIP
jgi:hypothetical protein